MRVYFIAMSIRIACVASLFFVRGWWIILVAIGAVVIPYFAVIFANERASGTGSRPDAPSPRELTPPPVFSSDTDTPELSETLLVVDDPAERRRSDDQSASRSNESQNSGKAEE